MSKVYAPWSRLTLYRGQWLVMQSNVDEASARVVSDTDVYAQSHVAVPNSVAAAAPDMLEALRSCEANLRLIHEAAGPVPRICANARTHIRGVEACVRSHRQGGGTVSHA